MCLRPLLFIIITSCSILGNQTESHIKKIWWKGVKAELFFGKKKKSIRVNRFCGVFSLTIYLGNRKKKDYVSYLCGTPSRCKTRKLRVARDQSTGAHFRPRLRHLYVEIKMFQCSFAD